MTETLWERIGKDVSLWRENGYPCEKFPLIGVILRYQTIGDGEDDPSLRYLREPQFRALEVYWYLRTQLNTPKFLKLYQNYYQNEEILSALGMRIPDAYSGLITIESVLEKIKMDSKYAEREGHDSVHESLNLEYPSYIFALAMGTGKTVLIGSIVATEFCMSIEYPGYGFMENALVFAPGTTIIESLRELVRMPYQEILPKAQYHLFMAHVKIQTPSGRDNFIQVENHGKFNLVITNTEKIILRRRTRRLGMLESERNNLVENYRLSRIAQLPNLGVFSDEAHHTYGNKAGEELKRVRETINLINKRTGLVCVVNTTGTPYYKGKSLKEVVIWYGLKEGIEDNILKSLQGGVRSYEITGAGEHAIIEKILGDFYGKYRDVRLPGKHRAKIAFYFKQQDHLDQSRKHVELALIALGESLDVILVHTVALPNEEEFLRLNDSSSEKRVILLIRKGTEGWDCPSLFATALIKQQSSSVFVLQAASRCLRQVPGNRVTASIYLDEKNRDILEREIYNNFGVS
ncbi:MAG: DEAD/DEAH box helicase family protein, partial [Alphaproteobacteria bacterium]